MIKVVVLILTICNSYTGETVLERRILWDMQAFSISGDRIEDCRKWGVDKANFASAWAQLKWKFRPKTPEEQYHIDITGHEPEAPNFTTNINCHWEPFWGQKT